MAERKKGDRIEWCYEPCDPENGPSGRLQVMGGTIEHVFRDGLFAVLSEDGDLCEVRESWIQDPDPAAATADLSDAQCELFCAVSRLIRRSFK